MPDREALPHQSHPDDDARRDALTHGIAAADASGAALDDPDTFRAACEWVEDGIRFGRLLRERGLTRDQAAGVMGGIVAQTLLEALGDG